MSDKKGAKREKRVFLILAILTFAFIIIGVASACIDNCARCGDGLVNQISEQCDDGNTINNDGCSSTCKIEYCGDGIKQANEECDDGNSVNGDGCSNSCCLEEQRECVLELTKTADKTNVKPGDIVTFTLKYKNTGDGNCTGTGVKIQDTLDWNLNYRGSHNKSLTGDIDKQGIYYGWHEIPGYNEITNTLTWNANVVSPGEEGTIVFEVRVLEPEECGDFQINNYFKAWSYEKGWQTSNSIVLNVDYECPPNPCCGNGILEAGEECDDGNNINGDGCSSQCDIEEEQPYCGDGIINQGWEECDDGNNEDDDGCSSECQIEECQHYCGDGYLDLGEECDLGEDNGDVCTPAYGGICSYCSDECEEIILTDGYCGDGILQSQHEQCDDGNNEDGDGCSANCEEEQQECIEDLSIRYSYSNSFGTGIAFGFENGTWISALTPTIDKGNYKIRYYIDNNVANTTNYAHIIVKIDGGVLSEYDYLIGKYHSKTLTLDASTLSCQGKHNISLSVASEHNPFCEADEDSDNYAERDFYLSCGPACGNGILEAGEECDDGNNEDGDGCSANCDIEEEHYCGDGSLDLGEECDLGILNGVTCTPPYGGSCTYCSGTCKSKTLYGGFCGDKIKQDGEECDDGNTNNLDSCRNNCKLPYCGDGIKDKNEYCDDGNQINGDGCSKTCRLECEEGYCTPNITIEEFVPKVWQCDNRFIYDDGTRPGRVTQNGEELTERINNYAFEGEQIKWKVLVMDKNGIDKVKDVYVTVDGYIEANCDRLTWGGIILDSCNARILEEPITNWNSKTMAYYECTLTVETPESMYGESEITVEAEDLFGNFGVMDEKEVWFLNPTVYLEIDGGITFNSLRPGTTQYSGNVVLTNGAEEDSGVLLDMFISGTDFYDSSSSGAKCPTTNQLSLSRVKYYATNGDYSTMDDMEIGRSCDAEGYCGINYGIGFNNPYRFYDRNEIIQANKVDPYYAANLLAPGADMSIVFRVEVPEPCIGNFDSGRIYFWGEAV